MLSVIATIVAKEGKEAEFEAAAKELAVQVNKNEPGCLLYVLCKSDAPRTFVFIERYRDQAATDAHRASDHFKTLGRKMGEFMDGRPTILRLTDA